MNTILTPERVQAIFLECHFQEGEDTRSQVIAEGIVTDAAFHRDRLNTHRAEIEALLAQLPDEFKRSGGGGMSFLNACMDRHGNQWAGEHTTVEQLFQLGLAIGKVEPLLPRELWSALPGGMPYYIVAG